jgi:lipopolysaccharide transport system permease protein
VKVTTTPSTQVTATADPPAGARRAIAERVVTYLPDNSLRRGYLSLFGDIVRELAENRYLTFQLFKRDVFAFYKQSLLGAFWIVFVPLITVGTFVLLRGSGVVEAGQIDAPYPVYAVIGVAIWQLFSAGLVAGANSLVLGGEMISRINFSKKALVIAAMGRTIVSFVVLLVLAVVLFAVYVSAGWAWSPSAALLLVPLSLLPTLLLTVGLSFYLALLNGVVRDIGTMLSMVVTFLMLLTPVLYERPRPGPDAGSMAHLLADITEYNPMYYLVAAPRELVLEGAVVDVRGFAAACVFSVVVFGVALVSFHLTETRIAERI